MTRNTSVFERKPRTRSAPGPRAGDHHLLGRVVGVAPDVVQPDRVHVVPEPGIVHAGQQGLVLPAVPPCAARSEPELGPSWITRGPPRVSVISPNPPEPRSLSGFRNDGVLVML